MTRVYGYDPNGNLTQKQSLPEVGTYGYDPLDRLTATSRDGGTDPYGYDANGNRIADARGSYGYMSATNRLTTTPDAAITLDPAGNLLSDGTRSFTYHQAGHLAGTTGAAYVYDHRRLRTRKTVGSSVTLYHYDLNGRLILETNNQGQALRAYVWDDHEPIAQIETGEKLTYLHTDHLGTVRLGTNTSGAKVWSWEGEAFGDTLPNQDPDGDGISTIVNLRYPGQYYDQETGLFYNWNRYYDPKTGRYLTSDPIGIEGGINTYAYVKDNPLRWIDPTGLVLENWEPDGPGGPIYIPIGPFGPVCGPAGQTLGVWLPDAHFGADYTAACQGHDDCYNCSGRSRQSCDDEFCRKLLEACNKQYGSGFGRQSCDAMARRYCREVRQRGEQYYQPANSTECCSRKR